MQTYDYCAVTHAEQMQDDSERFRAFCSDDSVVIFPRVVKEGEGVYFSPYTEGTDTTTVHGYIKLIEMRVP